MTFDPYDQNSWFFGALSRNQAIDVLKREKDKGVFLVRNSTSIAGDLVLSVREENKISHYIINKVDVEGESRFKIGENTFHDLPALLTFYKHHYLDTTPLIKAAIKKLQYVRAKFEFLGKDKEDLPFKKNEVLAVISKDEDQWWTARNKSGNIGSIPVPYVEPIDEEEYEQNGSDESDPKDPDPTSDPSSPPVVEPSISSSTSSGSVNSQSSGIEPKTPSNGFVIPKEPGQGISNRKMPAKAIVVQQRIPNAYDKRALKLEKGDIITVTSTNINGQWEGETTSGKRGHFPFNYIKFVDDDPDTL